MEAQTWGGCGCALGPEVKRGDGTPASGCCVCACVRIRAELHETGSPHEGKGSLGPAL